MAAAIPMEHGIDAALAESLMISGEDPKPRGSMADVRLRVSTVLLLLALAGLPLRLSAGDLLLQQASPTAELLLATLAPVWAICGSVSASVYLVLGMWRRYNAVQHLLEMAAGVLLTVLMLPVF